MIIPTIDNADMSNVNVTLIEHGWRIVPITDRLIPSALPIPKAHEFSMVYFPPWSLNDDRSMINVTPSELKEKMHYFLSIEDAIAFVKNVCGGIWYDRLPPEIAALPVDRKVQSADGKNKLPGNLLDLLPITFESIDDILDEVSLEEEDEALLESKSLHLDCPSLKSVIAFLSEHYSRGH